MLGERWPSRAALRNGLDTAHINESRGTRCACRAGDAKRPPHVRLTVRVQRRSGIVSHHVNTRSEMNHRVAMQPLRPSAVDTLEIGSVVDPLATDIGQILRAPNQPNGLLAALQQCTRHRLPDEAVGSRH